MLPRPFVFRAFWQQCSTKPGFQYRSSPTWRYFTSSAPRTRNSLNPGSTKRASSTPSQSQSPYSAATRQQIGFGMLERRVAKDKQVLLYKAPPLRTYVLSAYAIAAASIAQAVYTSEITFRDPIIPLQTWHKLTYGAVCIVMSAVGTVFLVKTFNMIKFVQAFDYHGRTLIRFGINRWCPFLRPRTVDVVPAQITYSRRLVTENTQNPVRSTLETPRREPLTVKTFFTAPVKGVSRMLWRVFYSVKRTFTSEDFILVNIDGQNGVFKMDTQGPLSEDFFYVSRPR